MSALPPFTPREGNSLSAIDFEFTLCELSNMEQPTGKQLIEATGISPAYASMILGGSRTPPRSLAIHIFRKTGWKHESIASLTDDEIDVLERVDPWKPATPSEARDAA